ncbi:MAG: CoA-binding protein [Cyanosarcina radialis HA8281-LM2]|nr:CoA-binding protein [Cyanosarcina radialis HA8281-LM2]
MSIVKLDDTALRDILTNTKVIAVVGHSDKPERTSYQIAQFLRRVGYTVIPVNPAVKEIDGEPSYTSLAEVPLPVDLVNIFRRSEYLREIVEQAIAIDVKTIWAQLGINHESAAQQALAAGMNVVMDACIKIEYQRLKCR